MFSEPPPASPGTPPPPAPGMGYCAKHPYHPASGVCERCGDFMCSFCSQFNEGRYYCHACASLIIERGGLQADQKGFMTGAWCLAAGSVFALCPMAGVSVALVVIIVSLILLGEATRRNQLPGRGLLIASICISALGLVAQVVYLVFSIAF